MANKNYNNYSKPKKEKPVEVVEPKIVEETGPSTTPVITEPTVEEAAPKTVIGTVINCEKLNIRAEAKADAKIVGTFFKGQEIELYIDTSTNEFYDVSVGFCMKKYIKLNK
jgi:uncharacterized protein YgiM (DUF1202 family)